VNKFKKWTVAATLSLTLTVPQTSRADFFGGDVVILVQILANAVQQLTQLQQILGTGTDTLSLLREVNRGLRDGLAVLRMIDPQLNPGLYGDLRTADQVLGTLQNIYGRIPQTADARLQAAQDQSASESIAMNGTLFEFADHADQESRRIFEHSQVVNPQGAGKLTAQSIAVLISVTTQVLRTNSMMLKMMGQNMALTNRKEKIQSSQFRSQYDGLSDAFRGIPNDSKLSPLRGEN
jgi:hypothetical protein